MLILCLSYSCFLFILSFTVPLNPHTLSSHPPSHPHTLSRPSVENMQSGSPKKHKNNNNNNAVRETPPKVITPISTVAATSSLTNYITTNCFESILFLFS